MQQTNVLEYLESTVTRLPDKIAFANENMGLTFGEVYHDSRAIGSYLSKQGYYNEPVVVFMEKHPKMISAFSNLFSNLQAKLIPEENVIAQRRSNPENKSSQVKYSSLSKLIFATLNNPDDSFFSS